MAEKIKLQVVTPERAVLHAYVDDVVLPGVKGQMDILPGHLPLLAALDVGQLVASTEDGERHFLIDRGYAEVYEDEVTVLTEACEGADEIDIEQAKRRLKEAREELERLEDMSKSEEVEEEIFDRHRLAMKRQLMRMAFAEGDVES